MRVLVVYASKYGSTKGIAERIAATLNESGQQAAAVPVAAAGRLDGYDAFVVGSAAYMSSWLKEATDFVQRNSVLLSTKPVWLFSSGPLGTESKDAQGRDMRENAVPKQIVELSAAIHPREHRVFYGAFDHTRLNFAHRMIYGLPAARKLLVEGDFRDWEEIDSWAKRIAGALIPAGMGSSG